MFRLGENNRLIALGASYCRNKFAATSHCRNKSLPQQVIAATCNGTNTYGNTFKGCCNA